MFVRPISSVTVGMRLSGLFVRESSLAPAGREGIGRSELLETLILHQRRFWLRGVLRPQPAFVPRRPESLPVPEKPREQPQLDLEWSGERRTPPTTELEIIVKPCNRADEDSLGKVLDLLL